ncbi:hypothetical protein LR066_04715 [candidate division WOR-3 bacterium]|nr:hypothetical protein [candidate division WOR-3 bacterium]
MEIIKFISYPLLAPISVGSPKWSAKAYFCENNELIYPLKNPLFNSRLILQHLLTIGFFTHPIRYVQPLPACSP